MTANPIMGWPGPHSGPGNGSLPSEHWGAGDTTVQPGSLLDQYGTPAVKEMCHNKTNQINRSDGDWAELIADNSRGPGGPMGPLCTPVRAPVVLSRPSITH